MEPDYFEEAFYDFCQYMPLPYREDWLLGMFRTDSEDPYWSERIRPTKQRRAGEGFIVVVNSGYSKTKPWSDLLDVINYEFRGFPVFVEGPRVSYLKEIISAYEDQMRFLEDLSLYYLQLDEDEGDGEEGEDDGSEGKDPWEKGPDWWKRI